MGPLTKLVGSGIGLTKEAQAHRARSKSPQPPADGAVEVEQQGHFDPEDDGHLDDEDAQWELDDFQDEKSGAQVNVSEAADDDTHDIDKIIKTFFDRHLPPAHPIASADLPLPVILPQKRPQSKAHGFIHAYAPVLEGCGVDQQAWFEFLDGFSRSIKYSKTFHAVNGAVAMAAHVVTIAAGPSPITVAVALTIHISLESTRRGYVRYESNKYLDSMNERYFQPRGLYAMVITFKPYSSKATEDVDWDQKITADVATRGDGGGHKFGGTSGKTFKDIDVPESAPLIFPKLDQVPDEKKKSTIKETGSFLLGDYYDRRSRAKFENQNPDSKLNVMPTPEFASRFSDPNHPANSGNIVSLVTGGKVARQPLRERAKQRRQMLTGGRRGQQNNRGGMVDAARRKIREDIVYLMVVNMPSAAEMEQAKEAVNEATKGS